MREGILSALALNLANLIGSERSHEKWERMHESGCESGRESGCKSGCKSGCERADLSHVICLSQSDVLNLEQESGCKRADAKERMRESGCERADARERMRESGCERADARERMRESGCERADARADSKSCENPLPSVIGCDRSAYPIRRNPLPREMLKFLTFDTNSTSDWRIRCAKNSQIVVMYWKKLSDWWKSSATGPQTKTENCHCIVLLLCCCNQMGGRSTTRESVTRQDVDWAKYNSSNKQ